MENYFIIHGCYGNPYKNFIPWLQRQISKRVRLCIDSCSHIFSSYLDTCCINFDTVFFRFYFYY